MIKEQIASQFKRVVPTYCNIARYLALKGDKFAGRIARISGLWRTAVDGL